MGWIIAILIIFLLAILPLGVSVIYNADGPLVRVVAGPVKIKVFPLKKKEKKPKDAAKKEKKPKKTKEKPKEPAAEKKKSGGSVTDFIPFIRLVFDFLVDFKNKLRINHLKIRYTMAGGDPADLAINYGKTWAALGNIWPRLETWFVIKKRDVAVQCDFEADEATIDARIDLTITLGRLLSLVFRYAFRALKEYLIFRKKRNGGKSV